MKSYSFASLDTSLPLPGNTPLSLQHNWTPLTVSVPRGLLQPPEASYLHVVLWKTQVHLKDRPRNDSWFDFDVLKSLLIVVVSLSDQQIGMFENEQKSLKFIKQKYGFLIHPKLLFC